MIDKTFAGIQRGGKNIADDTFMLGIFNKKKKCEVV